MTQISSELLATIDIILCCIQNNSTYMGGLILIITLDHTEIQPLEGRHFLTLSHIITWFKMVALDFSVQVHEAAFYRIHEIVK